MKRILTVVVCIGITLTALTSCIMANKDPSGYMAGNIDEKVVKGNIDFAFEIFNVLNNHDGSESIFISPFSISTALAMTYNGSETTTKQAMAMVLGWEGIELNVINDTFGNLIRHFEKQGKEAEILVSNSIWTRKDQVIKQDFIDRNKNYFKATVDNLDFSSPSAADIVNNWISEATKNKIDKMIIPPIDPNVIMYLINGIYFKGLWSDPFDPDRTFDGIFTSLDKSQQSVKMMHKFGTVDYLRKEDFRAVRLYYGNKSVSMTAILPDEETSMDSFIEGMNRQKWESIQRDLAKTDEVMVQIPRFKLEYGIKKLNDALIGMGMAEAFDGNADFSGIRSGIFISQVLHKAVIEVNEKGSEAAAATVVEMSESLRIDPPVFIADRPFIFIISDEETGTVLFIGKVASVE